MAYSQYLLFANNAATTIASPITSTATTLTVATGTGSLFPNPSAGQAFVLTLQTAVNPAVLEIVLCTARSTDTLTIVRGQEGTTARAFSGGDSCSNYPTSGSFNNFAQSANFSAYAPINNPTFTGNVTLSGNATSNLQAVAYQQLTAETIRAEAAESSLSGNVTTVQNTATSALNATTQGLFTNLSLSANGTTAAVNVSANSLVVTTSGNLAYQLKSVSLTANTGGTSGAANSLDTGAWSYSTWYYVHVIYNTSTTTQALLFSLSATTPTLPSGYTAFARVGSVRTQSATNYNPLAFTQYGRNVQYLVGASGNVTTYPVMTSGVLGTITTSSYTPVSVTTKNIYVPPTASILKFILTNSYGAGGAPYPVVASPSTNFGGVTTVTQPPASIFVNASTSTMYFFILESNNIYYASQSANGAIYAIGWEDNL